MINSSFVESIFFVEEIVYDSQRGDEKMENKMEYYIENDLTVISFYGEVDVNNVSRYRRKINAVLTKSDGDVMFNFQHTTFIDSAGVGLVLGRYQQLAIEQRKLTLCSLSKTAYKVFELSGLFELMDYLQEVKI